MSDTDVPGDLHNRVTALERLVADLAEDIAYGTAGHLRTKAQNKALAVLTELRPAAVEPSAAPKPHEMCLRPRVKDSEDSEVCVKRVDHEGGHLFGLRPKT